MTIVDEDLMTMALTTKIQQVAFATSLNVISHGNHKCLLWLQMLSYL
jgi:hypothetical protein